VIQLRPTAGKVPFNRGIVPLVITFDVVLLGFMFVAVMVFQEKQEGSIRAFRITPGRPLEYIISKASVNILLGLLYTFLLILVVTGIPDRLFLLVVVVILCSLLMTLTGLLLSVFFNNLSEFLFVAVFISALFTLPMISYFQPSFAPSYLQAIPAYPVLFGLREILFPTGNEALIASVIRTLTAETVIVAIAAYGAVQRKLMKEGY
jgi:ABC-2 type transport system permease protein/fluoroquinolone transport system permease protein